MVARRFNLTVMATAMLLAPGLAASALLLDNTSNGTAALANNDGPFSTATAFAAWSITTPGDSSWTLTEFLFGAYTDSSD